MASLPVVRLGPFPPPLIRLKAEMRGQVKRKGWAAMRKDGRRMFWKVWYRFRIPTGCPE